MHENILIVLTISVLEGLLSADNALVLAVLVRSLPKHQHRKALLYGIGGAFVFRFIAILSAATLIKYWYVQLLGALYLGYLAARHFISHSQGQNKVRPQAGFWHTVMIVELTDIAFAIDSILAAVALTRNIWLIYFGGIIGLIFMRYAASLIIKLLEKFPLLEHAAYLVIGWIAVKLGVESFTHWQQSIGGSLHPHIPPVVFWSVTFLMFAFGFLRRSKPGDSEKSKADLLDGSD